MRSSVLWGMLLAAIVPGCAAVDAIDGDDGEDVADAEVLGEELVTSGGGIVNTDNVNLRSAPSTNANVVQVLDRGTQVTVTGAKKASGGFVWVPVKAGAKEGWLAAKYLSPLSSLDLDKAVAFLGREVSRRSPGSLLSIAVHVFNTNERASLNENEIRPSASSAKAMWAAAALSRNTAATVDRATGDTLEEETKYVFQTSNNETAARLIALAGGVDAVNDFYTRAGMTRSGLIHWCTGNLPVCRDTNEPRLLGDDNYVTAKDAVTFLDRLNGSLLSPVKRGKLLSWMKYSPDSGDNGGWLPNDLPEPAHSQSMHKAGWLPGSRTINEIGFVPTGSGKRYAVAILSTNANSWGAEMDFVEYASCVIYRAVEKGVDPKGKALPACK